jgi:hypothetical protein
VHLHRAHPARLTLQAGGQGLGRDRLGTPITADPQIAQLLGERAGGEQGSPEVCWLGRVKQKVAGDLQTDEIACQLIQGQGRLAALQQQPAAHGASVAAPGLEAEVAQGPEAGLGLLPQGPIEKTGPDRLPGAETTVGHLQHGLQLGNQEVALRPISAGLHRSRQFRTHQDAPPP